MPLTCRVIPFGLALLVAGCATSGSVRRVESEVAALRATTARQDSARAAELARVIRIQQQILDSLGATREALRQFRGELGTELVNVQELLVQIQELTGQSQRRLGDIRRQIEERTQQFAVDTILPADTGAQAPPPVGTPDQLYHASVQEYQRGSMGTARLGFQEFVRLYPTHPQLPDVLHFLAETFATEVQDSAVFYHRQVVERFPQSPRASTSLYKLGRLAEQRGDRPAARALYQRVIREYPRSDEANLAQARLNELRP